MQVLQRINLEALHGFHALDRRLGACDGGVVGDPLTQCGGPQGSRIRDGAALFFDAVDHQGDLAVLHHIDHIRPTLLDLVHGGHRHARSRDRCRGPARGHQTKAQRMQVTGAFDRAGLVGSLD